MEFDNYKTTIEESIETKEALKKLEQQKRKAFKINAISTVLGVIGFILFISLSTNSSNSLYIILAFACIGLVSGTYAYTQDSLVKPYLKNLKVARENDKVRHEERIRFYERKRLEENGNSGPVNIDLAKRLKEEREIREKVQKELEALRKSRRE